MKKLYLDFRMPREELKGIMMVPDSEMSLGYSMHDTCTCKLSKYSPYGYRPNRTYIDPRKTRKAHITLTNNSGQAGGFTKVITIGANSSGSEKAITIKGTFTDTQENRIINHTDDKGNITLIEEYQKGKLVKVTRFYGKITEEYWYDENYIYRTRSEESPVEYRNVYDRKEKKWKKM
jgi:hypothetical protein